MLNFADPIRHLTFDIIGHHILHYMTLSDLHNALQVSREWRRELAQWITSDKKTLGNCECLISCRVAIAFGHGRKLWQTLIDRDNLRLLKVAHEANIKIDAWNIGLTAAMRGKCDVVGWLMRLSIPKTHPYLMNILRVNCADLPEYANLVHSLHDLPLIPQYKKLELLDCQHSGNWAKLGVWRTAYHKNGTPRQNSIAVDADEWRKFVANRSRQYTTWELFTEKWKINTKILCYAALIARPPSISLIEAFSEVSFNKRYECRDVYSHHMIHYLQRALKYPSRDILSPNVPIFGYSEGIFMTFLLIINEGMSPVDIDFWIKDERFRRHISLKDWDWIVGQFGNSTSDRSSICDLLCIISDFKFQHPGGFDKMLEFSYGLFLSGKLHKKSTKRLLEQCAMEIVMFGSSIFPADDTQSIVMCDNAYEMEMSFDDSVTKYNELDINAEYYNSLMQNWNDYDFLRNA